MERLDQLLGCNEYAVALAECRKVLLDRDGKSAGLDMRGDSEQAEDIDTPLARNGRPSG